MTTHTDPVSRFLDAVTGGEQVRFSLRWIEDGEPIATHQVHVIELADGQISRHEMWCGGRWNSQRQAEISAAC